MTLCRQSASHYPSQCWPCRHALYLFNTLRPNGYMTHLTHWGPMCHITHLTTWDPHEACNTYLAYNIYINILTLHESYNTHLTHWDPMKHITLSTHWHSMSHISHSTDWDPRRHITHYMTESMVSQHLFRQWLGANRPQTLTWVSVDIGLSLCLHMASPSHNGLSSLINMRFPFQNRV